jgi:hypothetical protein
MQPTGDDDGEARRRKPREGTSSARQSPGQQVDREVAPQDGESMPENRRNAA